MVQKWKLLPNLQQDLGPLEPRAGTIFWTHTKKGTRGRKSSVACDIRFRRLTREEHEPEMDLEDLLARWFKYVAQCLRRLCG